MVVVVAAGLCRIGKEKDEKGRGRETLDVMMMDDDDDEDVCFLLTTLGAVLLISLSFSIYELEIASTSTITTYPPPRMPPHMVHCTPRGRPPETLKRKKTTS